MTFLIGVIVGYMAACTIFAVAVYLHMKYKYPIKAIEKLERALGPKATVIMPRSETELRQQRIIAENDAAGRDTKLSDLL